MAVNFPPAAVLFDVLRQRRVKFHIFHPKDAYLEGALLFVRVERNELARFEPDVILAAAVITLVA